MSRPAFALSDPEARQLAQLAGALHERHPLNPRDHRPYVRDFLRAVHSATGRVYSPAIHRRLLAAYAPGRCLSTATLALEKALLTDELALAASVARDTAAAPVPALAQLVRNAVHDALGGRQLPPRGAMNGDDAGPETVFWRTRFLVHERALRDAQVRAASLATELQAAQNALEQRDQALQVERATLTALTEQIGLLTSEVAAHRLYALKAIDEVRGETRAWKVRCGDLETLLQQDRLLMETFRQLAYRRGADIPPALQPGHAR